MIEIWYSTGQGEPWSMNDYDEGWYWWWCEPGCLPDTDPQGPFRTEAEAKADAEAIISEATCSTDMLSLSCH